MLKQLFSEFRTALGKGWREGRDVNRFGTARGEQPVSPMPAPAQEISCHRCGSRRITVVSGTHDRCADCGNYTRLTPADADLRPQQSYPATVVRTGFGPGGGIEIREYDLAGNKVASRPATRKDRVTQPTPVGPRG